MDPIPLRHFRAFILGCGGDPNIWMPVYWEYQKEYQIRQQAEGESRRTDDPSSSESRHRHEAQSEPPVLPQRSNRIIRAVKSHGRLNAIWIMVLIGAGMTLAAILTIFGRGSESAPIELPAAGSVAGMASDQQGRTIASIHDAATVTLWRVKDKGRRTVTITTGGSARTNSVALSPDGSLLASGNTEGTVWLWDVSNLDRVSSRYVLVGHTGSVNTVTFSPDGRRVASGSADNTVALWDVSDPGYPRRTATLTGHTGSVNSVAFSLDGRRVASGSADNTVALWDVSDPGYPRRTATLTGHTGSVNSVAFSPDGRRVASGSADNTVALWDITETTPLTSRPTATITCDSVAVKSIAFDPAGSALAIDGGDGKLHLGRVNNLNSVTCTSQDRGTDSVIGLIRAPGGSVGYFVSRNTDGIVRILES